MLISYLYLLIIVYYNCPMPSYMRSYIYIYGDSRFQSTSSCTNLCVGVTKGGKGKVLLNSHVESIVVENGRATGVQLRSRKRILKARRAVSLFPLGRFSLHHYHVYVCIYVCMVWYGMQVISNASIWDTTRLLPENTYV